MCWFYVLLVLCVVGSGDCGSMCVWLHVLLVLWFVMIRVVGYMFLGYIFVWFYISFGSMF